MFRERLSRRVKLYNYLPANVKDNLHYMYT